MTETVRELAKKLQAQGIAMSESQAMEMAENIKSTGSKVNAEFTNKRDEMTMDPRKKREESEGANQYKEAKAMEMRQNAVEPKPIDVQAKYDVPGVSNEVPLNEAVDDEPEVIEEASEEVTETPYEEPEPVEETSEDLEVEEVDEAPQHEEAEDSEDKPY